MLTTEEEPSTRADGPDPTPPKATPTPTPTPPRRAPGRLLALVALLSAALMALHAHLPNTALNLGSLFQTLLPWTGLAAPALLALAGVRRSKLAAVAVLAPALVWATLFGPTLTDTLTAPLTGKGTSATGPTLTVLSHNVDEANPDPAGTARALAGAKADVLALVELSEESAPVYERELAAAYPHHAVLGGVGLWSRHRLTAVAEVEIMPWTRAMRATAVTPEGPVAVYAAHLASVRVSGAGFTTARRNEAARALASAVRAEPAPRVVVLGDFNGTYQDRALAPVTSQLRSAQREAGDGFGFTYPAGFPVVRIDDVLVKGMDPRASWTLPATGSDHRPVAATLRF
ncbi:endonuclease/exonuclease/phosphatase family protein [Streptomyces cyaneofuscatus]|uniref:endonuclease/exonuclease/phosphatase family protein n=1 Tax=Streptomyces cyaneofuscatus TaxID=66883 RepID=UPI002E152726|nr:endonuclease/exonuclease/phosphatase family protein [Streptomyces cyaneofuscatus]WSI49165.1 endonuclease/exonuclease/phosphatase family protein [Streptomyces cyaneofuscatus]